MITRDQAAANHRRLVAIRDRAIAGTAERLRAEINIHMSRWTLNSNSFTAAEIDVLERPRWMQPLPAEDRARISRMISPKSRQWLKKALLKKHEGSK